ncbi:unnamed protein product [Cochlearia groenlandica]
MRTVNPKGDIVIDATCGNGNDTLAMLKMVTDDDSDDCDDGYVYALDIQKEAIESISSLLDQTLGFKEDGCIQFWISTGWKQINNHCLGYNIVGVISLVVHIGHPGGRYF